MKQEVVQGEMQPATARCTEESSLLDVGVSGRPKIPGGQNSVGGNIGSRLLCFG